MTRALRMLLPVLLLTSCRGAEEKGEAVTTIDSAGVAIVVSTRPRWQEGDGWRLSADPEVVIGQTEGDEKYMLTRVQGVRRLSDGRIAILDGGAKRLRIYDRAGKHVMDLGGEGDAPSEFRLPAFLGVSSDTLFVYDQGHDRVTWFAPDGRFVRTSEGIRERGHEGRGSMTSIFGFVGDRFLVGSRMDLALGRTFVDGLDRAPWSLWRFDARDSPADSLLQVPGIEVILSRRGKAVGQAPHVFGKSIQLASSSDRVVVAPTDAFSFSIFDGDGVLERIVRRPWEPRPVRSSDLDEWIEHEIARRADSPQEEADMRRTAGDLSVAETMPAFRWLVVDADDDLWVEEWKGAGFAQGSFSVFAADGAWLGDVDLPEGLPDDRWVPDFSRRVIEIGSDYVLGVWTDEMGVEQVRLYGLEKAERP